ncbi:hypothetical protein ACFLXZ_00280 [Chloroflexota bacterium]
MPAKNNIKKMRFVDEDEGFIKKLAKAIGCHYSKANERTYNLNRFDSNILREMGVFAWVHKEGNDCFWVSTRRIWVEGAKVKVLAGRKASGINCFPKDTQPSEDSVNLDTKDGYQKTVSVLKMIKNNALAPLLDIMNFQ